MMKVAAVQMCSTDNVEQNLNQARGLVELAVAGGATLVALPENFAYLRSEAEDIGYTQSLNGELTGWLRDLARFWGIYLLAGSFPETAPGGKVYNSSLLLDPEGTVLAHYRKIHLFDAVLPDGTVLAESRSVEPGTEVVTAVVDGVTVGLSICYDLRFPELYRRLVAAGAEVLFVPAAFTFQTGQVHWEILLRARAIENQAFVVAPAQFGQHTPNRRSYGHAMVVDPWGTLLGVAPEAESVVLADLDFDHLRQVRTKMPCLSHRRLS